MIDITERQARKLEKDIEKVEQDWNKLEAWQREKLVVRAEIMTGQKWIRAVVWGMLGVILASAVSIVAFGVTRVQALGLIALVAFVAFAGGYIMGVRNN